MIHMLRSHTNAQGWQPIWLAVRICRGWFLCIRWRFVLWLGLWQSQRGKVTINLVSEKFLVPTRGKVLSRGHDISTLVLHPLKCRQCFCLVNTILLEWATLWTEKNSNHTLKLWYFTSKCGQLNRLVIPWCDITWHNVTQRDNFYF